MKRLYPYIKPYWPLILLALGLLYVMASTDLALPDYLSQIINIGIQQNGIDTTIPEVMRASSLEKIALFQSEQERAETLAAYQRIEPGTPASAALVPYYPGASLQPVYKRNALDAEAAASLEKALTKPLVVLYGFQMMQSNPQQAASFMGPELAAKLKALPAGTRPAQLILAAAEAQLTQVKLAITQHLNSLDAMMLRQMAVRAVGNEYSWASICKRTRRITSRASAGA